MAKILDVFVIILLTVSVVGIIFVNLQIKDLNNQISNTKVMVAKSSFSLDLPKIGVRLTSDVPMENPQVLELPGHTKIIFSDQTLDFYNYDSTVYQSLTDWWRQTEPQDNLEFCSADSSGMTENLNCRPYLSSELNIYTDVHLPDKCNFGAIAEISISGKISQDEGSVLRSNYFLLSSPKNLIFRLNHDDGGGESDLCPFGFRLQIL